MAAWPTLEEFSQVVNVDSETEDWTLTLARILASAIARVKLDVGAWDEDTDVPDEALSQAALRMAELIAERPEAGEGTADPTYWALLYGHRRRFALA